MPGAIIQNLYQLYCIAKEPMYFSTVRGVLLPQGLRSDAAGN